MLQFIAFALINGIMIFIWSFVFINKSNDKINQAFLAFLSIVLIWMILSVSNGYEESSAIGLVIRTIYWYSMMSMSVFFLLFTYRFIKKELNSVFYILVSVNTLTIIARYFFPIDYSDPTFWRLSHPVVAPMMSAIFSLPAVYALYLVLKTYFTTKESRKKAQLKIIFTGTGLALLVSIVSEYILPTLLKINMQLSLMYFSVLIFVVSMFISIMKHRLLNMQSEYIYRKLFLQSDDGIMIVNKNNRIVCINSVARELLNNSSIDAGDKITDYLSAYEFEKNYKQYEMPVESSGGRFLSLTQYPIDSADEYSAKLLTLIDITAKKNTFNQEKDVLIRKSFVDRLTGLYNKHYLYDYYYSDKQGWDDEKITLMFIDIDGFKQINDLYGHMTGDTVLKDIAESIIKNVGSMGEAFRFGGDEFLVIYKDIEIEEAYRIAENIRLETEKNRYKQYNSDFSLTLSIGLVEGLPPLIDLITKADMAMYNSKVNGKNKTTVFTEKLVK